VTLGALILAIAGTIVGSLFTLYTSARLTRETGRTAARLIYAELTRNSAPVSYYLYAGTWPQARFDTPAWNEHSQAIAKMHQAEVFNTIYKGYAALEAIAYIAQEGGQLGEDRRSILTEEIRRLCAAISKAGEIARVHDQESDRWLASLEKSGNEATPGTVMRSIGLNASSALIPSDVLIHIRESGTVLQQRSAQETIDLSEAARPTAPAPDGGAGRVQRPAAPALQRVVYDANGGRNLTRLRVARQEGGAPIGDPSVDETYETMGTTHAFFWEAYSRDFQSYSGRPIKAAVHYGQQYDNIFWDGSQIVVGDGDGQLFNRFSIAPDVVAHELCHALVEKEAGLQFANQAGALNESICDVFGVLVKQYTLHQQVDQADWLLGKGLFLENIKAQALRSLAAPGTAYDDPVLGKDRQVSHMDHYVHTIEDNGGVHINAGIPAHAFYRVAMALGGFAWDRAGRIWYEALGDKRLRPASGFSVFAGTTVTTAQRLYGEQSPEAEAVWEGWKEVGVHPSIPARRRTRPAVTLET
jgi:hypothetical protein